MEQLKHTHTHTPDYRAQSRSQHPLKQTKQYWYHQLLLVEFRVCPVSKRLMHTWVSLIFRLMVKRLTFTPTSKDMNCQGCKGCHVYLGQCPLLPVLVRVACQANEHTERTAHLPGARSQGLEGLWADWCGSKEAPQTCNAAEYLCCGREPVCEGSRAQVAAAGWSGTMSKATGFASGLVGVASAPAFGAEPRRSGGFQWQYCGGSLRVLAWGSSQDKEYPENPAAGCLVCSPPVESLWEYTRRMEMSTPGQKREHTDNVLVEILRYCRFGGKLIWKAVISSSRLKNGDHLDYLLKIAILLEAASNYFESKTRCKVCIHGQIYLFLILKLGAKNTVGIVRKQKLHHNYTLKFHSSSSNTDTVYLTQVNGGRGSTLKVYDALWHKWCLALCL